VSKALIAGLGEPSSDDQRDKAVPEVLEARQMVERAPILRVRLFLPSEW
jgi:hypothetical protein